MTLRFVSRILTSFFGVHVLERPARTNRNASPLRGSASRFARGWSFQYMKTLNSVSITEGVIVLTVAQKGMKLLFYYPTQRILVMENIYLNLSVADETAI